jgi:hypothetical protein
MVTLERSELVWEYQPKDFFEETYSSHVDSEYDLVIESGRALVTLRIPRDPIDEQLQERIATFLESVFLVRQFENQREYHLHKPLVRQHTGGGKYVAISTGESISLSIVDGQSDSIIRTPAGDVIRDIRKEHIKEETTLINSIAPKLAQSPTLRSLLNSFSKSVSDRDNEFVHLYEILDALSKHYRDEKNVWATLNCKTEWGRLVRLTCNEPLKQGRHRGLHFAGLRDATSAELDEARDIARKLILLFAQTV